VLAPGTDGDACDDSVRLGTDGAACEGSAKSGTDGAACETDGPGTDGAACETCATDDADGVRCWITLGGSSDCIAATGPEKKIAASRLNPRLHTPLFSLHPDAGDLGQISWYNRILHDPRIKQRPLRPRSSMCPELPARPVPAANAVAIDFEAGRGDHHGVFELDKTALRMLQRGLDGDHHAGFERPVGIVGVVRHRT
jgi:hypothetical protein